MTTLIDSNTPRPFRRALPASRLKAASIAAILGVLVCSVVSLPSSAKALAQKREHFQNAEIIYDWVKIGTGQKLRTFITRPKNAPGKVPVVFIVGWLSCDSVEYPAGETDGFGAIILRLADKSGFATVRMDKPGVGESEGDCAKTDFQTELQGYRAAFDSMSKYDFLDLNRVFVVGLSNGGGTAPLIAGSHPVAGFVAASSWGRTWYEHMLENERVRLSGEKHSAGEINQALRVFTQFYDLFLIQHQSPGEILAKHPDWKPFWYDTPDGQYGRPAAFYQQLQDLNLGEVWQKVSCPVLVMRGGADTIMSDADSRAIVDNVNRSHPGKARFVEIPGADHSLAVGRPLHASVFGTMTDWMRQVLGERRN